MTRSLLTRFAPLAGFVLAAFAAGCSNTPDGGDVAADTIGLARERPGALVIEEDRRTLATPYGGYSAAISCDGAARDIVRLTALLGPDLEAPPPPGEGPEGTVRDREGGARDFASDLSEDIPELATDAAVDAVVGLNPARPVVRFLAQSGEIEAEARRERELALKRRAWLRGAFDALDCDRAVLIEAHRTGSD
ncbi:MAG: hypothetical protein ACFE0P_00475 [Oceanicaulis sp.]